MRNLAAALAIAFLAGPAHAADPPITIKGPIDTERPCGDLRVLERIMERFAWEERHTWHRGYVMVAMRNPRPSEHAFFEPGLILRDYCMADSVMSNGSSRTVYYTIEHRAGFASIGANVDYCVLGLDPWHVHDEACRTVR